MKTIGNCAERSVQIEYYLSIIIEKFFLARQGPWI